jgi:hypothetical protein
MRNVRGPLVPALLIAAIGASGCATQSIARLKSDCLAVAAAPANIPANAVKDTCEVCKARPWTILVSPAVVVHEALKHGLATGGHALDLLGSPVVLPLGWEGLGPYDTAAFPFSLSDETDARLSEALYVAYGCAAAGGLLGHGRLD